MSSSDKQTFSVKDLSCSKVVVFTDRAEVSRIIKLKLKKGESEIILSNISNQIDNESVRVEGQGEASVLDVVCQYKSVQEEDKNNHEKVKELKAQLKDLEHKLTIKNNEVTCLTKKHSVLSNFADSLSKPKHDSNKDNTSSISSSKENVENFLDFLEKFGDRLETYDEEIRKIKIDQEKLNDEIRTVRDNINKYQGYNNHADEMEVTILVEAKKDETDVELIVSYVVYSAAWTPKYDIRVFGKEKKMVINYYGVINQSTGEDWNDTKLSLSTAVPSIGGNVPELDTTNVRIKPKVVHAYRAKGFRMAKSNAAPRFRSNVEDMDCIEACDYTTAAYEEDLMPTMAMSAVQVQKSEIGSTSTFEIPRNATIPADNNSHKVSIGIINLKPEFQYETVPKKNAHCYLKAKVVNSSEYLMLAGPANVFFDNNFVAKTDLKSYSPQEEFECSLGVDPAIRIEYKPVKINKGQSGLISKSTLTTYTQLIEVKNTTSNTALVFLSDTLPLSNDDKIKVKLEEPHLKSNPNVSINKANNLEFRLFIAPNTKEEITIKYSIDHPSGQEVEFF